ncbi:MAG TPA: COX15/CtaA family protein [Patescibacteria group bacterium]|nr:COX15/CtaA family protein [Patescibacteria group bacterium]
MERRIVVWLYICCFMVFAMAVIGAVTRLTESGLSITEWKPVSGAIPPLNEAQWQHEYDLYRQSPEFHAKHFWMSLADFKHIFFWEWLHRLVGRLIGLVYTLPLLWFAIKKQIPPGYGWKFAGVLALGASQGLLGWWMVESGLVTRPSVSHFRLAAHLVLALTIYSCMWWLALSVDGRRNAADGTTKDYQLPSTVYHAMFSLALLVTTITWGAFTAGLHAGKIYNTFPLMDAQFTPTGAAHPLTEPGWVQFTHRWLAITTGLTVLALAWRVRDAALAIMVFIQIGLGISTLLSSVWLPLGALHQAGAVILLTLLLRTLYRTTRH